MAQTTGAITGATGKIEMSVDNGSTYIDISGSASSIDGIDFSRVTGSQTTFAGEYRIITAGKQLPTTITINALYTEVNQESAKLAVSGLKNKQPIKLRWQYADVGATTYYRWFNIGTGRVGVVTLPESNAENGEPIMVSFTVEVGGVDYELIEPEE